MTTVELDSDQVDVLVRNELISLRESLIACMEDPEMIGHVTAVLSYYSTSAEEDCRKESVHNHIFANFI